MSTVPQMSSPTEGCSRGQTRTPSVGYAGMSARLPASAIRRSAVRPVLATADDTARTASRQRQYLPLLAPFSGKLVAVVDGICGE
jgi:hypothetical protein